MSSSNPYPGLATRRVTELLQSGWQIWKSEATSASAKAAGFSILHHLRKSTPDGENYVTLFAD